MEMIKVEVEKSIEDCIRESILFEAECMKEEKPYLERTFADNITFFVRILRALENDKAFRYEFLRELEKVMQEGKYKRVVVDKYHGINSAICECSCVEKFRDGLWK